MQRLAALIPLLAGCGGPPAAGGDRIECAMGGAAAFERVCIVERAVTERGLVLTIRSPTGSVRRLVTTKDGSGVAAADGAEAAAVKVVGPDRIEVAIGGDRYRLPATMR